MISLVHQIVDANAPTTSNADSKTVMPHPAHGFRRRTSHPYRNGSRFLRLLLALGILLAGLPLGVQPAAAAAIPESLHIENGPTGVQIQWRFAPDQDIFLDSLPAGFDQQPAGPHSLPIHTVVLWPRGATPDDLQIELHTHNAQPYHGPLPPAPAMTPNALDYVAPAYVDAPEAPPLPTVPVYILRTAQIRGQTQVMVALSPIFQDSASGRLMIAGELSATIHHAYLPTAADNENPVVSAAALDGAFGPHAAVPPTNPHANGTAWQIRVMQGGIQELKTADLAAAGLNNANTNTLALFHNGQEVALQIIDTNGNARIDGANDAIRFYAPTPGDRWNQADVYWLAQGVSNPTRMAVQPAAASSATLRNTAYADGIWRASRFYNSNIPGHAGDGWFHLDAIARSGVSQAERTFQARIAPALPLATPNDLQATVAIEASLYRLEGSNFSNTPHRLRLRADGGNPFEIEQQFSIGGSTHNVVFETPLPQPATQLEVGFLIGERPLALLFDRIHWRQPVDLNFRIDGQNRGARFHTIEGEWRYRLRNLAGAAVLYEISDPRAPRIIGLSDASDDKLLAASAAAPYIVAGLDTLHTPAIQAHTPSDLRTGGAVALYIAPAGFHSTLEPLVQHRQSQGYRVRVVDIQQIYDGWSYGQVAPDAIRDFLRHAVATWRPAPISVVFVGDGTHDPHSYLGHNNPNVIPPYMARVDPWLGETACDNCYGQLDGAHPLDPRTFTMDIWVGRFPVINTTELRNVVNKIIRYETATDVDAPWRSISVQIADDYFNPDGTPDRAGDFVESAESINALKPDGVRVKRNYFNVRLSDAQVASLNETQRTLYEAYLPWYIHDPDEAWQQSIRLMNQGAGLVTYTGHANHWKWAATTEDSLNNYLFGLWDVLQLNNRDRLFIGLSMTCYTSQFTEPAPSHFTIDEHLLLRANGGAAAVWGPAGLSVVHGHDTLQKGFHKALWSGGEPMTARMGELLEAGYAEIRKQACCQDVLKTFLLLGDPLMPARVHTRDASYVPSVRAGS